MDASADVVKPNPILHPILRRIGYYSAVRSVAEKYQRSSPLFRFTKVHHCGLWACYKPEIDSCDLFYLFRSGGSSPMLINGEQKSELVIYYYLLLLLLLPAGSGWIGLRFPLSFFSDHGCPDFDLWVSLRQVRTERGQPRLDSSRRVFRSSREPTLSFASEPHALDEWGGRSRPPGLAAKHSHSHRHSPHTLGLHSPTWMLSDRPTNARWAAARGKKRRARRRPADRQPAGGTSARCSRPLDPPFHARPLVETE